MTQSVADHLTLSLASDSINGRECLSPSSKLKGYSNHHEQQASDQNAGKRRVVFGSGQGLASSVQTFGKAGLVTVKHPDGDIPKGTLNSIKKQAGLK